MTLSVQPAIALFDTARGEACGVAPVGVADPTFFAPITKVQREAGGVRALATNDAGEMVAPDGTVGGVPVGGETDPVTGGSVISTPNSTLKLPAGETDLSSAGSSALRPLMLIATRGEVPGARVQASDGNHLRFTGRSYHKTGGAAKTIAASWQNFYLGTNRVETNVGNTVTIKAHFEIPGAATPVVVATWTGASSGTMPDGAEDFQCDEIPASAFGYASEIPAGTAVYIVTELTVTSAQYYPYTLATTSAEKGTYGSGATSQIGTAGAIVNQEGGAAASFIGPAAVLGRSATTIKSAILFGNSLVYGYKDNKGWGDNGGGFFVRAAWNGGGTPMPWARQAMSSTTTEQAIASCTKQSALWKYATHFINDLGTNGLAAGNSASKEKAFIDALHKLTVAKGCKPVQMKIINRVLSSTDAFATEANQTVLSGFETGGKKDVLNALIDTSVGLSIVAAINANVGWAGTTYTDRIAAPGITDDGVHPLPAGCAAIEPGVRTQLFALS